MAQIKCHCLSRFTEQSWKIDKKLLFEYVFFSLDVFVLFLMFSQHLQPKMGIKCNHPVLLVVHTTFMHTTNKYIPSHTIHILYIHIIWWLHLCGCTVMSPYAFVLIGFRSAMWLWLCVFKWSAEFSQKHRLFSSILIIISIVNYTRHGKLFLPVWKQPSNEFHWKFGDCGWKVYGSVLVDSRVVYIRIDWYGFIIWISFIYNSNLTIIIITIYWIDRLG